MTSKNAREKKVVPLTDKLLTTIVKHINQDHAEDVLACAKATPATSWAQQASLTTLEATGMTLEVSSGNRSEPLQIHFPDTAKDLRSLRHMFMTTINESRAQLGWPIAEDV